MHRFDPATKTLEIGGHLSSGQAVFKLAAELGLPGIRRPHRQARSRRASSPATSPARWPASGWPTISRPPTVLPYQQFHDVAENFRYDVERLSAFYSVSYETIAHRLSTLQRPSMRGVPLSFVRVDRAGNMSKRQSATGFHFSSSGGTCPLWNVYETFANPGKILVQIAADARRPRLHVGGAHGGTARRRATGSPARPSRSAWAANCGTRTGSSTPRGSICPATHRRHADRRGLPGVRAGQLPAARLPRSRPCAGSRRAPQHGVAVSGEAVVIVTEAGSRGHNLCQTR